VRDDLAGERRQGAWQVSEDAVLDEALAVWEEALAATLG
jgi:hypothetical protein